MACLKFLFLLSALVEFIASLVIFVLVFVLYSRYPLIGKIEIETDYFNSPIYDLSISSIRDTLSKYRPRSRVRARFCRALGKRLSQNIEMESVQLFTSNLYPNMTYSKLINDSVKKGDECPNNYKKCGILDTLDNIMCIKEEEQCPINLILIDDNEKPPSNYSMYKFTNIKLSNKYLHYTNEAIDNRIVVKFANYLDKSEYHKEYVVFPYTEESLIIDGKFNDFFIESCSFYKNDLLNNTNYNTISTNLYYRPFIGIKSKCLPSSSKENYNLQETLALYNKEEKYKNINYYTISVGVSTVSLICFILEIWFLSKKTYKLIIPVNILKLIIKISVLIISIFSLINNKNNYEVECYDVTTNHFNQLLLDIDDSKTPYITYISLASFCVIIDIFIVVIISIISKRKQRKNDNEETKRETIIEDNEKENNPTELIINSEKPE